MKTILIVDDEEGFCSLIKESLEVTGRYKVVVETRGRNAVRAAEGYEPDLVLLDVMMPDMSGLEVLKRLKQDKRTLRIPVIMLTANEDERVKKRAASLYDEDYITKPVSMGDLRTKVDDLLSRI